MISDDVQRIELEARKRSLEEYKLRCQDLRQQNTSLKKEKDDHELDALQIIKFLRNDAERKDELIDSLKKTIAQQREMFATQREEEKAAEAAERAAVDDETARREATREKRLQEAEEELRQLKEFKERKVAMEQQLEQDEQVHALPLGWSVERWGWLPRRLWSRVWGVGWGAGHSRFVASTASLCAAAVSNRASTPAQDRLDTAAAHKLAVEAMERKFLEEKGRLQREYRQMLAEMKKTCATSSHDHATSPRPAPSPAPEPHSAPHNALATMPPSYCHISSLGRPPPVSIQSHPIQACDPASSPVTLPAYPPTPPHPVLCLTVPSQRRALGP